jgi:hypothetical protein
MQSITSVETLHETILALEYLRREQELELASQCMLIYDGLRPVNIIKNMIRDLAESHDVRHRIANAAIGMVSGYLSRKLFFRSQSGLLRKIVGAAFRLVSATLS